MKELMNDTDLSVKLIDRALSFYLINAFIGRPLMNSKSLLSSSNSFVMRK